MRRLSRPDAESDRHGDLRRCVSECGIDDEPVHGVGCDRQPGEVQTQGTGQVAADGRIDTQPKCGEDVREGMAAA